MCGLWGMQAEGADEWCGAGSPVLGQFREAANPSVAQAFQAAQAPQTTHGHSHGHSQVEGVSGLTMESHAPAMPPQDARPASRPREGGGDWLGRSNLLALHGFPQKLVLGQIWKSASPSMLNGSPLPRPAPAATPPAAPRVAPADVVDTMGRSHDASATQQLVLAQQQHLYLLQKQVGRVLGAHPFALPCSSAPSIYSPLRCRIFRRFWPRPSCPPVIGRLPPRPSPPTRVPSGFPPPPPPPRPATPASSTPQPPRGHHQRPPPRPHPRHQHSRARSPHPRDHEARRPQAGRRSQTRPTEPQQRHHSRATLTVGPMRSACAVGSSDAPFLQGVHRLGSTS
jgi:hypothetical protein